ncbi:MAG: SIS domain-containing protein, partial [Syntrophobacterales bacterium]
MSRKEFDVRCIRKCIRDCAATVASLSTQADEISAISRTIIAALRSGRKILTAGNGGSAAEALHMAEEFVGRYRTNRK